MSLITAYKVWQALVLLMLSCADRTWIVTESGGHGRGGCVESLKVSPKQKESILGLSQELTFFSEVMELENKGVGACVNFYNFTKYIWW